MLKASSRQRVRVLDRSGLILDFVVTGFGLGMRHMELVYCAGNDLKNKNSAVQYG